MTDRLVVCSHSQVQQKTEPEIATYTTRFRAARIIAECPIKRPPRTKQFFDFEQVLASIPKVTSGLFGIGGVLDTRHLLNNTVYLATGCPC